MPQLAAAWGAGTGVTAWLTLAVQLGFVAGALFSAFFNLADVFHAPRLVVWSALLTAAVNTGFAYAATRNVPAAIGMRFLTGFAIAGVYPPGMKILAGWFRERRGLALGAMIGALGVGSAMPHLLASLGVITESNWRWVVLGCSAQSVLGALIVAAFIHDGPFAAPTQPFDPRQITEIFRNRRLALANLGYFGHMWELYAWWGWIAVFFAQSAALDAARRGGAPWPAQWVELASFLAMAVGGIGCVLAGLYSDRSPDEPLARIRQRSRSTIVAMALSGSSCLLTAIFFHNVWIVAAVAVLWGLTISADSAQFSAMVSEVADPGYVGSALTLQTAIGFLLTVVSIRVTALIGERYGWDWAAASLAVGPFLGIVAMGRLMREKTFSN
ncbi:MAG: MFS transporter [Acidobacteriales bacterium]|nr:MFS transporter [Terriglobales bacterium]